MFTSEHTTILYIILTHTLVSFDKLHKIVYNGVMTEQKRFTVRRSVVRGLRFSSRTHLYPVGSADSLGEAMVTAIPESHSTPLEVWDRGEGGLNVLRWVVWCGVVYEKARQNWPEQMEG